LKIVSCKLIIISLTCFLALTSCQSFRAFLGDYSVVGLDQPLWQEAYSEWTPELPAQNLGVPRLNRNVAGGKLAVDSLEFDKGISVGGNAVFIYSLGEKAVYIEFSAGVDDSSLAKNGKSKIEVICDGKPSHQTTLVRGASPEHCKILLENVSQVIILVKAETNVYTDLLMPRIVGIPGLREALRTGKTYFDNFVFDKYAQLNYSKILPDNSVIFPAENNCIGLSNSFASLILSPQNGGKVVSFGKVPVFDCSGAALHPNDRVRFSSNVTYSGPWKWRVDNLGILRFLSPPDLVNGVRWSRTFQLISNVVRTVLMAKNIVEHEISWSIGTEFEAPENSTVYFASESARPGFSLLAGNPIGIEEENGIISVSPVGEKIKRVAATSSESWLAIKNKNSVFFTKAIEKEKGYFPYANSRVMVDGNKAILFSEITILMPGKHFCQEQFWTIEPWVGAVKSTLEKAEENVKKAREFIKYPYGKPTGRKISNQ